MKAHSHLTRTSLAPFLLFAAFWRFALAHICYVSGKDSGVPPARLPVDDGAEGHLRGAPSGGPQDRGVDQHRRDVHHHRGLRVRRGQLQGQRCATCCLSGAFSSCVLVSFVPGGRRYRHTSRSYGYFCGGFSLRYVISELVPEETRVFAGTFVWL